MNICVFDIETIPDIKSIAQVDGISGISDDELFEYAKLKRRQEVGHEFIRHHYQKIVAISVTAYINGKHKVASLGEVDDSEKILVEKFFHLIDTYKPRLVSWNGNGFDLPVLHYRSLLHGVSAPTYWDVGHFDTQSKWSNYISRFQWQHMDIMDIISGYQARAAAPLNDIAKMCGFPGKLATDGGDVLSLYQQNKVKAIRDYCETDVLNTYLVYLRFELIRGLLTLKDYQGRTEALTLYLQKQSKSHFSEFLDAWQKTSCLLDPQ